MKNEIKNKNLRVDDAKWNEFKMICLLSETTMNDVLVDMINTYVVTNKAEALEKLQKMKWIKN